MAKFLGLLLVILLAAVAAFYFLVLRPQQGALAAAEQTATVCGQRADHVLVAIGCLLLSFVSVVYSVVHGLPLFRS